MLAKTSCSPSNQRAILLAMLDAASAAPAHRPDVEAAAWDSENA
jgi:hypothetical protein